jgi:hypothetical protein
MQEVVSAKFPKVMFAAKNENVATINDEIYGIHYFTISVRVY